MSEKMVNGEQSVVNIIASLEGISSILTAETDGSTAETDLVASICTNSAEIIKILKKERDAAVADLTCLVRNFYSHHSDMSMPCDLCINGPECDEDKQDTPCGFDNSNWEWRGADTT